MTDDLEDEESDVANLTLKGIIGFDGQTIRGFIVHPDQVHVVFALGNKVSILHWTTKEQFFLTGHTNIVSAIDVSQSGKYVASGQINYIGFKASVIIWDFHTRTIVAKHELHKVRVEAVAFSISDEYLLSMGGRDCGNVVVWDIQEATALCGSAASRGVQGEATVLCTTNRRSACFLTAGDGNFGVWRINKKQRNIQMVDVKMAKLKRVVLCMDLNERDDVCFCGTSTGDVLKVRMNFHHDLEYLEPAKQPLLVGCFSKITKKRLAVGEADLYIGGVRAIKVRKKVLLIGAGDGTVDIVEERSPVVKKAPPSQAYKMPSTPCLKTLKTTKVNGSVTSMQFMKETTLLIGTINCEIYSIDMNTFETKLLITCHTATVYDIAFPYEFSEVFATASKHDVRIWHLKNMEELLRIRVANFCCSSLVFAHDGKSLLTGWNDGVIRSFTPITGRLIYAILNAHNKGVSALTTTHDGRTLISGGCEGQVRLWDVTPFRQKLVCTLKEHKGPVSAIDINKSNDEAVSASTDGTCIIWDVVRQCRKQILFANTLFMCVRYYPTGVQILTGGSDRKLSYWEVLDGSLVRDLEGSTGSINSIEISPDGSLFVTGGNDEIVKLWKYQEGLTTHIGLGHSAIITAAKFSPDSRYILTCSASGSVFIWHNPYFAEGAKLMPPIDIVDEEKPPEEEDIKDAITSRSSKSSVQESEKARVCTCKNVNKCTCECTP